VTRSSDNLAKSSQSRQDFVRRWHIVSLTGALLVSLLVVALLTTRDGGDEATDRSERGIGERADSQNGVVGKLTLPFGKSRLVGQADW